MKRKLIALLLVVAMVMALMPTMAFADTGDVEVFNKPFKLWGYRIRVYTNTTGPGSTEGGYITNDRWTFLRDQNKWNFVAHSYDGYQFDGWTTSGSPSGAYVINGANLRILDKGNHNYHAYANFSYIGYTVTINLGAGATFNDTGLNTKTLTGVSSGTLTVPAYTVKPGYDRVDWDGSLNITGDTTINAEYEYEVTFVGNAQITITSGSPAWTSNHNVSEASYIVAPGFRFDGWDRSLNGITAPTTINANPAVGRGTIAVNSTGEGSLTRAWYVNGTYDFGTSIRLNDAWPATIPSSRHIGWRDNNTGQMLAPDVTITVSGDCTYTAVFGEWLDTSAGSNGSLTTDLDGWYEDGTDVNLNDCVPLADYGFEFDKWIEEDFFGHYQRDVALVGGEPIITIGDSNYFKALFKTAEYTVTFEDSQGEVLGTETVLHGGDVTKTAGGFTYDAGERPIGSGWNATEGQNITADKTIVVNTEYEVTFNLDGGTKTGGGDLVQWVAYGTGATAPVFDPPAGAQFTGWDKTFAIITQAETVTAKYEFLVEFVDDAGNVLASEYVASGGDAATTPGSITLGSGQRYKNSPAWNQALAQNITAQTSILVELEYEVTFDLGGGTWTGGGALSQWVAYGGSATAPVFDDPADANFIEWDTTFDNITDATCVTAVYEYLVEFVDDAGNVLASEYVKNGEDAVTVEGDISLGTKKRFKNSPAWNASEGQNITAPKQILVELEYRVRFRLNGGTRTGGGTLTQWIEYGGSATAPTLDPPTGKVFSSWSKAFNNITSSKIVRARYSWIDYTLTINFLDRADNSDLVPAYVGTYHYTDAYSIVSPAVLGYDMPSIDTVAGTMPADDVVVNVYYDSHKLRLTYMQNDGDLPTDLREYRIYHKDSVSDEYPVKVGYKLAGSPTIVEIGEIGFVNSEANRFTDPFLFNTTPIGVSPAGETCIIYWYDEDNLEWIQADTKAGSTLYQATFDANTGAFADTSIVKFDYAYVGGNIVSPDLPTKEGHTFIGWDVNGDGVIDASDDLNSDGLYDAADIDEITMSANVVITAIYEINTFEVKFFDHDGTQIGTTQTVDWNTAATAPADPTRDGYTFGGWDTAFDAVKANLDVTATYTINTFEVKFLDHDGTQIGTTQTVDWNTAATAPADPTRDGHTFAGWDKAFDAVKADLDVTATYTINTFEVKFFDYDGTQIGTMQTVDWNTAATAPADPERLGHTFDGWDTVFDAVTANIDVTATYTINSYTVTFVDHDGTVLKTERVNWRDAATAPADPTREGYEFTGWDKEFDRVVRYMTVTALYDELDDPQEPEEDGFLVQFFDDEGNLISEQRVEEGGSAEAPEPPVKEGYEFAGWDKEFDPITQDLVVTALYTKLDVPSTNIIDDEPSAEADLTDTTQGSFPWWWIVAGAGAIALLLLILFFVKRRKDQEEEA